MEPDSNDPVDRIKHGPHNIFILFTCTIVLLGAVFDLFGVSVIAVAASCDLNLGLNEISFLTSLPFAGYLFALPWGYYADTRGRRKVLLISTTVGTIFGILSSFSTSFQAMLFYKFIGCIFSAPSSTLIFTYLGECTRNKHRNKYLFILNSCSLATDFVFYALAYLFLRLEFNIALPWLSITYRPWRLFTLVLSLPLGIGAVMMAFLHETPSFLASQEDTAKALNILKINHGTNEEPLVRSLIREERREIQTTFWNSLVKQVIPIFSLPLLWSTIKLFVLMAISVSTNNIFFMWCPTLLKTYNSMSTAAPSEQIGFCQNIMLNISATGAIESVRCDDKISESTICYGIMFSLLFTIINLVTSGLVTWRKVMFITIFVISGSSAFLLNFTHQPILTVIIFILLQLTGVNIGNVICYFHDLYPTTHRGLATNLGMMFAKLITFCGVNIVGAGVVHHCNITFYAFSLYIFCGALLAWRFLPTDRY